MAKVATQVVVPVNATDVEPKVPVQPPDQPVKFEPVVAVAVSEMFVGGGTEATVNGDEHVIGQVMPAGTDITVPRPVPARLMPRDACVGLTNIRLR